MKQDKYDQTFQHQYKDCFSGLFWKFEKAHEEETANLASGEKKTETVWERAAGLHDNLVLF